MKKRDLDAITAHAVQASQDEASDVPTRLLAHQVILAGEILLQLSDIKQVLSGELAQRMDVIARGFTEFDQRVSGRMAITRYDISEEDDDGGSDDKSV